MFIGVYIMKDNNTEKSLKNLTVKDNENVYRNIIDNCSMYVVNPNMDKFWLMDNWVLAEWNDCQHSNPFESWKFSTVKQAKDDFYEIMDSADFLSNTHQGE
tara:strand:- start:313 stop:615 length:303 start_codon:yes stop_codon:yes gene_type:complete